MNPKQKIGFLPLLVLIYAYTTGGPFGYEEIFSLSGPGMAIAFLLLVPLFWSIPISLAAAEMNSMMPVQGGMYRWVRAAFGDFWGFQSGWWNWVGTFLLNASFGVLLMDYAANSIPGMTPFWKWAGASALMCALAYLNVRGIQVTGWAATALQVFVFVPVLWMCGAALLKWHVNPLVPFVPPGKSLGSVFGAGLALAMWNYAGYEQLAGVAEEVKNPQRTFVRALAWNTPLAILTYVVPSALALAALGNWSEWKTGYTVNAAAQIGGPALGAWMLAASGIGVAALSLSTILSTTRTPFAMAEDGYLPRWLGELHPRYGTPAKAIAFSVVIYCALATLDVVNLVAIYIPLRIVTSLMTLQSACILRRKMPDAPRSFRIPGGNMGLAYILLFPAILCAVKLYYSNEPLVRMWSPVLLASGPVAYVVLRWAGFKPRESTEKQIPP